MAKILFIDAFKLNKAPYTVEDWGSGERRIYLPEAYTDAYMIPSDVTGRLCRWLVVIDGKKISVLSHFGVRASKDEGKTYLNLLFKMNTEEKIAFLQEYYSDFSAPTRREAEKMMVDFFTTMTYKAGTRNPVHDKVQMNFLGSCIEAVYLNGQTQS